MTFMLLVVVTLNILSLSAKGPNLHFRHTYGIFKQVLLRYLKTYPYIAYPSDIFCAVFLTFTRKNGISVYVM